MATKQEIMQLISTSESSVQKEVLEELNDMNLSPFASAMKRMREHLETNHSEDDETDYLQGYNNCVAEFYNE